MINYKIKVLFIILGIIGITSISAISCSALEIGTQDSDINVNITPENPQPYKDVQITISSYATDLNKAMIEWMNGSNLILSGYGKTSYSFKALGPNTTSVFNVQIAPAEDPSNIITKQIVISPSDVDILWEGVDSYTPPFYRGKAFPSQTSTIRVVAIPDTSTLKNNKNNITYTWQNNDSVVQDASGYNKNAYTFNNSELNTSENITVTASSVDGQYNATGAINIPIISPQIIFYKRSPTEGILYNQALGNETTMGANEDEMTVVAEPYFLSFSKNQSNFNYSWQVNGNNVDNPSNNKNEITINPTARGGYAIINFFLSNMDSLFQKVTGQLKLDL